ncbi:GGDEF domain-containing protein [Deinococcus sp.]|uniref:GGDEF domain-containing protein n=1 Tax=Deinococcus sp. TaxID=47478 RepID=UPI0028699970|nr:GGDEF domain-containing protein [Deinococcus sp.]
MPRTQDDRTAWTVHPVDVNPEAIRERLRRQLYSVALGLGMIVLLILMLTQRPDRGSMGVQGAVNAVLIATCVGGLWWVQSGRALRTIERLLYTANTVAIMIQFATLRTTPVPDVPLEIASTHLLLIANAIVGYLAFSTRVGASLSLGSYGLAVLLCTWAVLGQRDPALLLTSTRLHVSVATLLLLVYALAWYRSSFLKIAGEQRALERQALTDPLTGLPNRHATYAAIERLLEEAQEGTPGSVILLDVDHFKAVNDAHGHPTGDRVLIALSDALRAHADSTHTPGRWGGEEFILVVPGLGLSEAAALAERLRTHLHSTPHPDAGVVTASFGVTTPLPGDDLGRLTARADQALYRAKTAGRNRVEVHQLPDAAGAD